MTGLLKINRLVSAPDADYQVNFTAPGKSYARAYSQSHLADFLRSPLGLADDAIDALFDDLSHHGNAMLEDIHIPEHEMTVLGFEQVASEF
jgi:hypothetical protein